jgi:ERCC4-type nuclease
MKYINDVRKKYIFHIFIKINREKKIMKIQVDFREKEIISNINTDKMEIETLSLPVGDFILNKSDECICIIERKTIADLSASIKDGRFREQKQRLIESVKDESRIIYIIEGAWNNKLLSKNIIESAILNLMFIHNYKVIRTKTIEETVEILEILYKKIEKNDFAKEKKETPSIQLISKTDKQKTRIFENQLCMISGVSMKIAESIKKDYKNMFCLINEYNNQETEKEREMLLVDTVITDKRKIGKALSKKIYISLKNLEGEDVK